MTNEQKEKILKWAGWKPNPDGNPMNLVWIKPNGIYRMIPELNTLDELMEMLDTMLRKLWGERYSVTYRHYEDTALNMPKEKPYHITLARWEVDPCGCEPETKLFVLRIGAFGDTLVELIQNALLKLAEEK